MRGYFGSDPQTLGRLDAGLKLIAHILAFKPLGSLEPLKKAVFSRVLFHLESEEPPQDVIDRARELGFEIGIGINPATDTERLRPYTESVDEVFFLSVEPLHPGIFLPAVLKKVKAERRFQG